MSPGARAPDSDYQRFDSGESVFSMESGSSTRSARKKSKSKDRPSSKSKSSSSSSSSTSTSTSSSSKSRSRRSRSRQQSVSGPNAGASLGRAVSVLCTSVGLLISLVLSLPRGADSRRLARGNLVRWFRAGALGLRADPLHSLKLLFWFVVLAGVATMALSAAGVDVGAHFPGGGGGQGPPSSPSPWFGFLRGSEEPAAGGKKAGAEDDAGLASDDDIPAAVGGVKKKVTRTMEVDFACNEVDCIEKCTGKKVTKKCLTSEGCLRAREQSCKKRCRKSRCDNRCKLEPAIGYVEREMKLDKCKEECASDHKCADRCDKDFQTCKSRCAERKKKFVCGREPVIRFPSPAAIAATAVAAAEEAASADEPGDDDGSAQDDDGQDVASDDDI